MIPSLNSWELLDFHLKVRYSIENNIWKGYHFFEGSNDLLIHYTSVAGIGIRWFYIQERIL